VEIAQETSPSVGGDAIPEKRKECYIPAENEEKHGQKEEKTRKRSHAHLQGVIPPASKNKRHLAENQTEWNRPIREEFNR